VEEEHEELPSVAILGKQVRAWGEIQVLLTHQLLTGY